MPLEIKIIVPDDMVLAGRANEYTRACFLSFFEQMANTPAVPAVPQAREEVKAAAAEMFSQAEAAAEQPQPEPVKKPSTRRKKAELMPETPADQSAPTVQDGLDELVSAAINNEPCGANKADIQDLVAFFMSDLGVAHVGELQKWMEAHPVAAVADTDLEAIGAAYQALVALCKKLGKTPPAPKSGTVAAPPGEKTAPAAAASIARDDMFGSGSTTSLTSDVPPPPCTEAEMRKAAEIYFVKVCPKGREVDPSGAERAIAAISGTMKGLFGPDKGTFKTIPQDEASFGKVKASLDKMIAAL